MELVSEEDQTNKLKEIYDNPNIGLGLGITSFYKLVKDKYIGITRDDVEKFLKSQTNYQLTKETHAVLINLSLQLIRIKDGQ